MAMQIQWFYLVKTIENSLDLFSMTELTLGDENYTRGFQQMYIHASNHKEDEVLFSD